MPNSFTHTFIEQWLQTATNGKVSVVFAWSQERMELRCHQCSAIYRCDVPTTSTEIDWALQSYVNKHSPMGTHGYGQSEQPLAPIPLTVEFKHPKAWDEIPEMQPLPTKGNIENVTSFVPVTPARTVKIVTGRRFR